MLSKHNFYSALLSLSIALFMLLDIDDKRLYSRPQMLH